jgi:hypothetical protein
MLDLLVWMAATRCLWPPKAGNRRVMKALHQGFKNGVSNPKILQHIWSLRYLKGNKMSLFAFVSPYVKYMVLDVKL